GALTLPTSFQRSRPRSITKFKAGSYCALTANTTISWFTTTILESRVPQKRSESYAGGLVAEMRQASRFETQSRRFDFQGCAVLSRCSGLASCCQQARQHQRVALHVRLLFPQLGRHSCGLGGIAA